MTLCYRYITSLVLNSIVDKLQIKSAILIKTGDFLEASYILCVCLFMFQSGVRPAYHSRYVGI